jgi:hypothetical protein
VGTFPLSLLLWAGGVVFLLASLAALFLVLRPR